MLIQRFKMIQYDFCPGRQRSLYTKHAGQILTKIKDRLPLGADRQPNRREFQNRAHRLPVLGDQICGIMA